MREVTVLVDATDYKIRVKSLVESLGMAMIKNMNIDSNDELVELSHFMGNLQAPFAEDLKEQVEDGFVYRVTSTASSSKRAISQTNKEFLLHTDGTKSNVVPDFIALMMIKPAISGGQSVFLDSWSVLSNFTDSELQGILSLSYQTRFGKRKILEVKGDRFQIKFNPYELAKELNPSLTITGDLDVGNAFNEQPLISQLCRIFSTSGKCLKYYLSPGDCIILDNRRILHGRTAFHGTRLLKRVWIQGQAE